MVANKKVFFGALFDFHYTACDEINLQFKEILGDDAPFMSYDKAHKAFTFIVDRQDDRVVSLFAGCLKTYIDEQAESGPDPYQSPKIRPLDGTVLQDPLINDAKLDDSNEGLFAIGNDDDSSDGGEAHTAPSHIHTYWKPQQGKISIVTTELATLLAQATGCSFFPDHGGNRVGISGANFNQALYKLQNLEKLQTLLASQRSEESSKAVANVLMLAKVEHNVAIQLIPLIGGTRPYERIVVSEQSQIRLDGKCVGELRYLQSHNRTDHLIPPNLLNPSGTAENSPSGIWAGFASLPLGSRKNMEPRRPSRSPSKFSSALRAGASSISTVPASLLPPTETRKIESWAQNIDEAVNPNEIAVEPPKDETRIGRQRRLANSDSDSDEDVVPTRAVVAADPHAVGQLLSLADLAGQRVSGDDDDVGSEVARRPMTITGRQHEFESNGSADEEYVPRPATNPPPQIGRRRRVKTNDSDDSSDGMPRSTSPQGTPQAGQGSSSAVKDVSDDFPGPSRRGPSPTCVVPSLPASFNVNAYRARGGDSPRRGRGAGVQSQTPGRGPGFPTPGRSGSSHAQNLAESGRSGPLPTQQETGSPGQARGQTQTRVLARGQNPSPNSMRSGLQSSRGRSMQHIRSRGRGFERGRGNAGGFSRTHSSESSLVDIASTVTTGPIMPPPGFGIRIASEQSPQSTNLLDEPLNNIERPLIPLASSSVVDQSFNSAAAGNPSGTFSDAGRYYVNTFNPRPDVAAMEQEQLERLLAQREELTMQSRGLTSNSQIQARTDTTNMPEATSSASQPTASSSNARLEEEDEVASRRYHHTMGQRAPNPGKKRKSQKPEETKKEREARIAKAKAEAHGDLPAARKLEMSSPKIGSSSDEVEKDMSARKKQVLKKAGLMAETDPAAAEDELRRVQTIKLADSLKPLFEAGRAFSGKLRFEIQFGQVISAFPSTGGQYQFIDLHEWHKRFHPQLGMLPEVASFTNILTTNGADADRILDMKSPGPGPVIVWSRSDPIPRGVTYEFQCQTKDNEEFWLVVNQNGTFDIQRSPTTVGMVNLHFPGQIWDACGIVSGVMEHHFSEAVVVAANAFRSSLYIPPGSKQISITYRLPDTNEMAVKNLVMKRKSLHNCNMLGKHDFQLQITEVQTLYHQFHKNDKKLGQAFVKDYAQMVNDGRLHYEVSLVDKAINELLGENAGLEVGELTNTWTEAKILSKEAVRNMVDLTTVVVSKIDGIGSKNIGTLFRKDMERLVQERQFAPDPAAAIASAAAMSRINLDAASHIQGVRGGRADVVWQDGQPYAFGFGGALVPIMGGLTSGSDEVLPDDSASQVGGPAPPAMPIRTLHPAQAVSISTNVQPRAGHGFW